MSNEQNDVRIINLSKHFGDVKAVDKLNLTIKQGEFVTLLGQSGCGKSTTLRMLGGFEQPTSGKIFLGKDDVTNIPPNKRDENMVFQDYALFPHMTVYQNIAFGLELKGETKSDITARVKHLLNFMELNSYGERKPNELSGGQRQRVALARALAPRPKVLLLDEPLGALDAKLRRQVQIELKDIQRRTGKTFIFVTHDQEEALTMSDRILVMNNGSLEQDGTPEEIYFHPVSKFVASFIGEANILSCNVVAINGNEVILDWYGQRICGQYRADKPEIGQNVDAVIRPEKVVCYKNDPGNDVGIEASITQRIFKGSYSSANISIGEKRDITMQILTDAETLHSLNDEKFWISIPTKYLTVLTK